MATRIRSGRLHSSIRMPSGSQIINSVQSQAIGAGMGIEYSLDPSAVILVAQFNKLGLDIRSFKEPLHRSVKYMGGSFQQNFAVSGRPNKWPELSDATIDKKFKLAAGRPSAPLIRSGLLQKTVGQQKIWKINGLEGYAAVNNLGSADYGIYHQEGFEGGEIGVLLGGGKIGIQSTGGLPARPFLVFQKEDEKNIEDIFIRWFQERTIAAGFRPGVSGISI